MFDIGKNKLGVKNMILEIKFYPHTHKLESQNPLVVASFDAAGKRPRVCRRDGD